MTNPESTAVLIRADAGNELGSGHVMRMIALGQALRRRGVAVTIASIHCPPSISRHIERAGLIHKMLEGTSPGRPEDSARTVRLAGKLGCDWIVLDGYHFGYAFQKKVREDGYRTAVMDDFRHLDQWSADLIINQNIGAEELEYPNDAPAGISLCGACYALLREEFFKEDTEVLPDSRHAKKLLITMGGVDQENVTGTLLHALERLDGLSLEVKVIVGGGNPHWEGLQQLAHSSRHPVSLVKNVTDMPALYRWSDRVISAGGSTCYEWLFLGRRAAVVELAENQRLIIRALEDHHLALSLGKAGQLDAESTAARLREWLKTEFPENSTRLVDGKGADRVAAAITGRFSIRIASDKNSWINHYIIKAISRGVFDGHDVELVHKAENATPGDLLFLLSYWSIVPEAVLRNYSHTLVVHASDLPRGRGWSPVSWQILEGRNEIPFCLLEAHGKVDSGSVFLRKSMILKGDELLTEIRDRQAEMTMDLCASFVREYPFIAASAKPQSGEPSYYPRRGPEDSELNLDESLGDQFNLLRIVDNESYPAFFKRDGKTYILRIDSLPKEKCPEDHP